MAENTTGRIPPQNLDAEAALLGSVLLTTKAYDDVSTIISKDDFYQKRNQDLWENICNFRNERPDLTLDLVSISQYLKEKGKLQDCGGPAYIASLTNTAIASSNASYYAQIIKENSLKRQIYEMSLVFADKAFDETQDAMSTINDLAQKVNQLGSQSGFQKIESAQKTIFKVIDQIHDVMAGKVSNGISSGFPSLDHYIGGFKPTDMIIIGARPSVGKTAFALSIAHNIAFKSETPHKVGFFSLEMSGASLLQRLLSRESSINSNCLRNGQLDRETDNRLQAAAERLYDKAENLYIQDSSSLSIMDIRSQARRMVREFGVDIIFIDYIGLIRWDGPASVDRHQQVATYSRELKSMARELNVPVICLSQVNREAGKDRAPILSDLRESGAIEQDADLVMLLDDPSKRLDENNKVAAAESEEQDRNAPGFGIRPITVIVAKQRNGSTGGFKLNFISYYVSFTEIERRESF